MDTKSTILIIDDHPIIHDGLKTLLASETDLEINAAAASAQEALDYLEHTMPDLAIVDLSLGDEDGVYLVQKLHRIYPDLKMLVYTMSEEKLYAERVAVAGAKGFVMKTSTPAVLKSAIHTILEGDMYFNDAVKERLKRIQEGHHDDEPQSFLSRLSNREMDIFRLVGQGLDTQQISEKLGISRNTVDTHRINIKNKLNLKSGKVLDRLAFEVIQQGGLS